MNVNYISLLIHILELYIHHVHNTAIRSLSVGYVSNDKSCFFYVVFQDENENQN